MEFMELANERRSVRVYADKPVPRALIDEAIRAAAAIPETEAGFAVIALGYRAQDPAPRPRKATEEIVTYI